MANYPTSLDSLTNPASGDALNNPDHASQHATANDILESLESKLGTGSSTPSTVGQVLMVTGSGATAYRRQNVWGIANRSGDYSVVIPGALNTSTTVTASSLRVCPFWSFGGTIDRIAINVTGAGTSGATYRIGIYLPDSGNPFLPGSLLLDAGTVAVDSTGFKEATVSQALDIGLYWIGGATQGSAADAAITRVYHEGWGNSLGISQGTSPSSTTIMCLVDNSVSGALPSTFSLEATSTIIPAFWLRWA